MLLTQKNREALLKTAKEEARILALLLDAESDAALKNHVAALVDALRVHTDNVDAQRDAEFMALRDEVESLRTDIHSLLTDGFAVLKEEFLTAAAEQAAAAKEAEIKAKYDSDEPYVNITSADFTKEGGIQLRLDWNKAFIEYLKVNGFTGSSEEAIVDKWITSLSNERNVADAAGKSGYR